MMTSVQLRGRRACAGVFCAACDAPASNAPLCTSSGKNAFDTYGAIAFLQVNTNIINNTFAEVGSNGTTNLGSAFELLGVAHSAWSITTVFTAFTVTRLIVAGWVRWKRPTSVPI